MFIHVKYRQRLYKTIFKNSVYQAGFCLQIKYLKCSILIGLVVILEREMSMATKSKSKPFDKGCKTATVVALSDDDYYLRAAIALNVSSLFFSQEWHAEVKSFPETIGAVSAFFNDSELRKAPSLDAGYLVPEPNSLIHRTLVWKVFDQVLLEEKVFQCFGSQEERAAKFQEVLKHAVLYQKIKACFDSFDEGLKKIGVKVRGDLVVLLQDTDKSASINFYNISREAFALTERVIPKILERIIKEFSVKK